MKCLHARRETRLAGALGLLARGTLLGGIAFCHVNGSCRVTRLAEVKDRENMAAGKYKSGDLFRRYHLPALSAEQNDCESEQSIAIGEPQAEDRSVKEAEVISVTKTKPQKRKASATSANSISSEKKARKFSWPPETIEALLKYTKEYKTKCEFSGVDFEADLQSLYTELRRCMANENPEDFGPVELTVITEVKDMDTAEYSVFRKTIDDEKARVRKGYERIKEKLKTLRQDYRNAVNRGTRSGSGKLVQDNYDLLTEIWGGSPATTSLSFGIDGDTIGEGTDTEDRKTEGTYVLLF